MIISKALRQLTGTDRIVFLFYAFLTNGLIISRLWKWKNRCSFVLMMFFYLTLYYPQSLNIMRQYVAVAVVFWAFDFVFEKKYKRYIVMVLIAACFHASSLLAIVFFPIHYYMTNRNLIKKISFSFSILILLLFVAMPLQSMFYKYAGYFKNSTFDLSAFTVLRTLLFLTYILLRINGKTYVTDEKELLFNDYVSAMYGISILTSFLGSFYDQMGRIGLCFAILGIPYEHSC